MTMTTSLTLAGKKALVTGAKRGIGRDIALLFAAAGADIAICGRHGEELEPLADTIKRQGRQCLTLEADITRQNDVDRIARDVLAGLGCLDILVNNAGTIVRKKLLEHSEAEWDEVLATNLKGYFLCTQAFAGAMAEQRGGSIISIASTHGIRALVGRGAYAVSKAGVIALTQVLAAELAPCGVRVNAIAPGGVKTEMNRAVWGDAAALERSIARIPLGRWAETGDVANAALFLASDASSYITGHTIVVDGGRIL